MKTKALIAAALLTALELTTAPLHAATFSEAKVTRLEKDVKILKENTAPHAATVGENVTAVTSVSTGAGSRVELMFPDKSLTRLGANSRFTIRGQGHTIDLDKGVLLFEVPEKLRDAKVRTAAVTAAVTGGTMIFEFLPGGFVKIMVIEGIVDLFLNSNPSQFSTLHAGQMIIQPVNATTLSAAVDFDLKLLKKTSKLLHDGEPNAKQIDEALNNQQNEINDGDLVKTSLVIPGLGTVVQLTNNTRFDVFSNLGARNGTPPPPGGAGGGAPNGNTPAAGPTSPPFQGAVPLITGLTLLGKDGSVKTKPQPAVTAIDAATGAVRMSDGSVYHPATDGPFPYFSFGSLQVTDPDLKARLEAKDKWTTFKFEKLVITGTPGFDFAPNPGGESGGAFIAPNPAVDTIPNIILSALDFVAAAGISPNPADNTLNTRNTGVESLVLYSQNGSLTVFAGFQIQGANQDFSLVGAGATSDVTIQGDIDIIDGPLLVSAGQDLLVGGNITAGDITLRSGRDVTINGAVGPGASQHVIEAKQGNLLVSAKRDIKVTNSAQLKALSELTPDALLRLESLQGAITIDGNSSIRGTNVEVEGFTGVSVTNSYLEATRSLKVGVLSPNGTLAINNSTLKAGTLINLYAQDAGAIQFDGTVHLDSPSVQIKAGTVQVKPTGNVFVDQNNASITAKPAGHQYNINTVTNPSFGTFHGSNITHN